MSPLGIPNPALWIWKGAFVLEVLLADCPSSQVDNLSISFRWGILLSLLLMGSLEKRRQQGSPNSAYICLLGQIYVRAHVTNHNL